MSPLSFYFLLEHVKITSVVRILFLSDGAVHPRSPQIWGQSQQAGLGDNIPLQKDPHPM